jgi:hypothetical protein
MAISSGQASLAGNQFLANVDLTGFEGEFPGRLLWITNVSAGATTITLKHLSTGSRVFTRIFSAGEDDAVIEPGATALAIYDAEQQVWRTTPPAGFDIQYVGVTSLVATNGYYPGLLYEFVGPPVNAFRSAGVTIWLLFQNGYIPSLSEIDPAGHAPGRDPVRTPSATACSWV